MRVRLQPFYLFTLVLIVLASILGYVVGIAAPSVTTTTTATETSYSTTSTTVTTTKTQTYTTTVTTTTTGQPLNTSSLTTTTTTTNTTTTFTASRTIDFRTFTGKTVAIDPSLQVQTIQSILLTGNATRIAQRLASALNELPVTLVSEQLPHGPNNTVNAFEATYNYRTSKDSHIGITFLYWNNQFQFYQLGYTVKDYTNLRDGTAPNNPSFNATKAERSAEQIMSGLGIPFAQVTLVNRNPVYISTTYSTVEWVQGYKGIPVSGTLVTDWGGSRITVPSTLQLEFYPPTGELIGISMFGPYWYLIPASFPLDVQPSTAISTGVSIANSQLNMSQVTYTNAALVAIQGHLYYVISVGNGIIQYSIYVNPRTGEVGFPQP